MTQTPEDQQPESITCPRCERTSYNPNDIREGYCGACHDWTSGNSLFRNLTPEEVRQLLADSKAGLLPRRIMRRSE